MVLLCKRLVGVAAALMIGGSTAALADQETPAQLRNRLKQNVRPTTTKPQTPAATQPQARPLTQRQQQQLQAIQKSVAVIVRVPKDASGRELKDQVQIRLRLSSMVQQAQTKKSVEAMWDDETVDATDFDRVGGDVANNEMDTSGDMNNEQWWGRGGWGGGFRPGWGGGFRPGWGGGFRPGWGGGFRPGWGGGFRPGWGNWGFRPGFGGWGWGGFRPLPVARPFFWNAPVGFYGFNTPYFYGYPAYNYYYYPYYGYYPMAGGCC